MNRSIRPLLLACLALSALNACRPSIPDPQPTPLPRPAQTTEPVLPEMASYATLEGSTKQPVQAQVVEAPVPRDEAQAPAIADDALPTVLVHKSETCGCCGLWVDHMRQAGFTVHVQDHDNLMPIKERFGVPQQMGSCHTAEVDGYFVEGHVPADDVKRLLADRPQARGIAVPGMPLGSPGMEVAGMPPQAYTVELVHEDGTHSTFSQR